MDPNHSKFILWTLSRRIRSNIRVLAFCGPEMKSHRPSEVPECNEIIKKAARGIEFTSKVDQNHLKYILGTLAVHFGQVLG
jgi:hypothetical protein